MWEWLDEEEEEEEGSLFARLTHITNSLHIMEPEWQVQDEATQKASEMAQSPARKEAELQAQNEEAAQKAKAEAERPAIEDAERQTQEEGAHLVKAEAESLARVEEQQTKEEAALKEQGEAESLACQEAERQAQDEAAQSAEKEAAGQAQDETVGQTQRPDEQSLRHEEADQLALEAPHTADAGAATSQVGFPPLGPSWGPLGALSNRPVRILGQGMATTPTGGDRPAATDGRQIATPGVGVPHWLWGTPHHSQEEPARKANAETAMLVHKEPKLQAQEEAA